MKILFFPYTEELGATHVLVKIAEQLKVNGAECIFVGHGKYVQFIKDNGFEVYDIIEMDIDTHKEYTRKASLNFHTQESIKEFIKQEVEVIEQIKPDAIVDLLRPTLAISSAIAKIPRVTVCNAVLTNYYDLPVEVPETHWAYDALSLPGLKSLMYPLTGIISKFSYNEWVKPYNKVIHELGLTKYKNILNLYEGDETIVMDAIEFAPLKKSPKVTVVGPILHDIVNIVPEWISQIDSTKNVIYVSMGSTGDHLPIILQDLAEYYGNNDNYQIVSNTLDLHNGKHFNLPGNFFLEPMLNANLILSKSKLVITHGGRGSIYHALQNGVPIIGIPHQPEQEWNMNRIESLKLGKKVSRRFYNKQLLKYNVDELIRDDQYKVNANKFQKILEKYSGAEKAAEVIIRTAQNGKQNNTASR